MRGHVLEKHTSLSKKDLRGFTEEPSDIFTAWFCDGQYACTIFKRPAVAPGLDLYIHLLGKQIRQ